MSTFGQYLRQKREASGISLRTLATIAGVGATYLSLVERDKSAPPTADRLEAMAHALGCDSDQLVVKAGRLPSDVQRCIAQFPRKATEVLRYTGVTKIKRTSL